MGIFTPFQSIKKFLRNNISADDMALRALQNGSFLSTEVSHIYHNHNVSLSNKKFQIQFSGKYD